MFLFVTFRDTLWFFFFSPPRHTKDNTKSHEGSSSLFFAFLRAALCETLWFLLFHHQGALRITPSLTRALLLFAFLRAALCETLWFFFFHHQGTQRITRSLTRDLLLFVLLRAVLCETLWFLHYAGYPETQSFSFYFFVFTKQIFSIMIILSS